MATALVLQVLLALFRVAPHPEQLELELELEHPARQAQLALLRAGLRLVQLELLELELERPAQQELQVFLQAVSAPGLAPLERREQGH